MKKLVILALCALCAVGCNKEDPEAYPGEKRIENTVWGYFAPGSASADMYLIMWDYDSGCVMHIKDAEGVDIHYNGKLVYYESTPRTIVVTPLYGTEGVPDKVEGTIDASGMSLSWTLDGEAYTKEFDYICSTSALAQDRMSF